ncbi:acyl-CoA thioesterase [Gilvimarinus sp. SDUM040013]|uniref:Acyl-CoA thioesterase n=1 Tax=Gilvimarinus gilvus TaxID=3058038 RepID=A0ABU4S1L5_9GAMM|nr:acyl-CoA thioesterase [Gilvimarinus sp. SDUM040013]MDO3387790.1 acyl-CoA thioesterase [Gilvimarinus sp. SDUM040013]MDX6851067.1 acyl-CoA thioesterase [Gilvimarinus sp. SDUM040013]
MTNANAMSVTLDRKVPFYDVDSMDIVWHGHYVKYFEDARCELLDALAYNYQAMRDSGYGFPVVDIRIKYVRPARFNRAIRIEATLQEWEVRLKIAYRIVDVESGDVLTKGYSVQVAVDLASGEMCYAMPDLFAQKLQAFWDTQSQTPEQVN